ncbi:anti-sigma factor [Rhodococcus sp. NPDC060084]|uniref:anti-sigma factor n=1 Tax=Rhodococcus sp. NPDC060084 TaxID=3347053 RepID=UPI0036491875
MALDDDRDLLDMAPVIALDALAPDERDEVTARLDDAAPETVERFTTDLRDARETLAQMSAATATEPPAGLRGRVLALVAAESATDRPAEHGGAENSGPGIGNSSTDVISLDERRRQSRRRNFLLAAAVAVVVALGGVVVANQWTQTTDSPLAERVLAAEDVRTTTGTLEGGGVVTVVFSEDAGAGVLVMNNVAPPADGTVYQMWLIGPDGPESAGTMTPADVAPSTTALLEDISGATALGFSVEPAGGSTAPTSIFAELPLG